MKNPLRCFLGFALGMLTVFISRAQAPDETVLATPVSQSFDHQDLLSIFYQLEQAYPIYFFYKEEWIPREARSFAFSEQPLGRVLQELLESTNLGFALLEEHLIVVARRQSLRELEAFSVDNFVSAITTYDTQETRTRSQRLVVGDSLVRPLPTSATISGRLFSSEDDQPINGGQITVPELQEGAIIDSTGRFALTLPTGTHAFTISGPGHEELEAEMEVFSDGTLDITLDLASYQLDEVMLAAESSGQSSGTAQAGRINLSMIDVQRMPPLMGEIDIINTILLKPGVTSSGEASAGFNIRGGNVDQNLTLYDGNMVFNTSHLLGFFSIFNPDVVESVSLYKGHIPAQYGGRISSVLDVDLGDGGFRTFKGSANVGLLSSKLSLEGPIIKEKTSFKLGGRVAYPNLLTQNLSNNAQVANSSAYYGDLILKLSHRLGDYSKLSVTGYASVDQFQFAQDFGYDWSTFFLNLKWQHIFSNRFSTKLEVSGGQYASELSFDIAPDIFSNSTGIDHYEAKFNALYSPGKRHNINVGATATLYDIQPDVRTTELTGDRSVTTEVAKDQGLELALYINDDFELNDLVSVSAGLRVSMFNNIGPYTRYEYDPELPRSESSVVDSTIFGSGESVETFFNLEPRLSVRVFLNNSTSLKASYNRTTQYVHLLSNTASIAPIDIWQVSNSYFPDQTSDNYSFGIFKDFRQKMWETSLELFYRQFGGQVVAKDFAGFLNNPIVEAEVLNARGEAYGAELSVALKTKVFKFDGAFTYMRSFRQTVDNPGGEGINDNAWFPADFDSPINLSLTAILTPNLWQSFSVNFIYRTGRPISQPLGAFPAYPNWNIPAFSERNNARIPDYHRLDISYSIEPGIIRRRKTRTKIILSVYNVYARQNPFSVFFRNEDGRFKAYQLSILGTALPFVGYSFSF